MININGFVVPKKAAFNRKPLIRAVREFTKPFRFFTDEELAAVPTGNVFVFDVECYWNFFYLAFKCVVTGKYITFEKSADSELNIGKLRWMLWRFCIVGFNSRNYDIPMITLAMANKSNNELKEASNDIVKFEMRSFDIEKKYKVKIPNLNHIDLIEVAPLEGSLKLYAGRIHCQRMQDLPIDEDAVLTREDAEEVRPYCCNDLDNTELLYNELLPQIKLREEMGKQYKIDLRSKSDAQLAEAVINSELEKITGQYPTKPTIKEGTVLKYDVPEFIRYASPELNAMLAKVKAAEFELDGLGSPVWPVGLGEFEKAKNSSDGKWILKVKINGKVYKMGMGGLHSQEKSITHLANDDIIISDDDVESFYPRIIINQRLFPFHLGEAFLTVFETIVNKRIKAKKDKLKLIADSLKITINGTFGKLGNKWSTIYAPQLLLQVTITGQLVLLMLIEILENVGIEVISGNTDGVVSKYHKSNHNLVRATIAEWERITNFKTENTRYKGIYSRDVNNYIAAKLKFDETIKSWIDEIEECKVKGAYSEKGSALNSRLSKNPESLICSDAVQALLKNGTPINKTILECSDIRRFVNVRNVKGGAEKNGYYLGKTIRWYYAKNQAGQISYILSGNKVPKTDGGKPLMDLPPSFPNDVNYEYYIKETTDILYDIGFYKRPTTAKMF